MYYHTMIVNIYSSTLPVHCVCFLSFLPLFPLQNLSLGFP